MYLSDFSKDTKIILKNKSKYKILVKKDYVKNWSETEIIIPYSFVKEELLIETNIPKLKLKINSNKIRKITIIDEKLKNIKIFSFSKEEISINLSMSKNIEYIENINKNIILELPLIESKNIVLKTYKLKNNKLFLSNNTDNIKIAFLNNAVLSFNKLEQLSLYKTNLILEGKFLKEFELFKQNKINFSKEVIIDYMKINSKENILNLENLKEINIVKIFDFLTFKEIKENFKKAKELILKIKVEEPRLDFSDFNFNKISLDLESSLFIEKLKIKLKDFKEMTIRKTKGINNIFLENSRIKTLFVSKKCNSFILNKKLNLESLIINNKKVFNSLCLIEGERKLSIYNLEKNDIKLLLDLKKTKQLILEGIKVDIINNKAKLELLDIGKNTHICNEELNLEIDKHFDFNNNSFYLKTKINLLFLNNSINRISLNNSISSFRNHINILNKNNIRILDWFIANNVQINFKNIISLFVEQVIKLNNVSIKNVFLFLEKNFLYGEFNDEIDLLDAIFFVNEKNKNRIRNFNGIDSFLILEELYNKYFKKCFNIRLTNFINLLKKDNYKALKKILDLEKKNKIEKFKCFLLHIDKKEEVKSIFFKLLLSVNNRN